MKHKKKILLMFLVLLFSFSFVACSKQSNVISTEKKEISEYLDVKITYTETQLEIGNIEETVAKIYDSVVAINVYKNQQHYGSGSGVLFAYDDEFSYVATCHHVIEGCQNFKIILSNNEEIEAQLVGGDSKSDLAVLAIKKLGLSYASWFKDTEQLRLGSSVICIGNPLGTLPGSVSTGVVSYMNRKIQIDDYNMMQLIQTDVAINSGNSGGGLFNAAGALIGIVNAKYSSSGIEGLGFAIPANTARKIIEEILTTASYDTTNQKWITGYVLGRWKVGFGLGYGGYGFVRTIIGIASISVNETESDYGKLKQNDQLNSITLSFKDSNKETKSLMNISAQTMTVDTIYKFIYSANLQLGDKIIFDITRNNEKMTIEIPLVQYRYVV